MPGIATLSLLILMSIAFIWICVKFLDHVAKKSSPGFVVGLAVICVVLGSLVFAGFILAIADPLLFFFMP